MADVCVDNQILSVEGKCSDCAEHTYPDEEGKKCISDICTENQILGSDGKCSDCAEFTYPDETGKACTADTCDPALF